MTPWLILGIAGMAMAWLLLHFIKKSTKLREENATLQKVVLEKHRQLEISARPDLDPSAVIDRLRRDGGA
jgi:hypothetical protein